MNPELSRKIAALRDATSASRTLVWFRQWPPGHMDAPEKPKHVVAWEAEHGPGPGSAERFLAEFYRSSASKPATRR